MNATKTVFQTVAAELSSAFETATRNNGCQFERIRDGAAAWIVGNGSAEFARGFHAAVDGDDPRMPDDWIYNLASRAASWLAGFETADGARDSVAEFADGCADHSTARLFYWLGDSGYNRALADEVFADSFDCGVAMARGFESGSVAVIQAAQAAAAERIANFMIDAAETEAARR